MKNLTKIAMVFIINLLFLFLALPAAAQYYYGGVPPTEQIIVDKKIKNPQSKGGDYVDNLGIYDYHFSPDEDVYFKMTVKNVGSTTISKVDLKDILPSYVDFVLGSGSKSKDIRDVSTTFENLAPDEERDFYVRGRIVSVQELPADKTLICVLNKAEATTDGQKAEDSSQLCLEKNVLGAVQPPAGADILTLGLGFLGMSGLGIFLKRKLAL